MTIFKDCYQTTVGSVSVTKTIVSSIKEAIIKDYINNNHLDVDNTGDVKTIFITGSASSEMNIPLFTHPIMFPGKDHITYLCTDLRFFIRKDTPYDMVESSIKNKTEYNFAKGRTILNKSWLENNYSQIKNELAFAGTVYAALLAETISKAYALDFKDNIKLQILSSFFYQCLFINDSEFTEDTKHRMVVHTIKATKLPSELVIETLDAIGHITDIKLFCSIVPSIVENVRLKEFNLGMLLTIVKNSWYGTNAKEVIQVALEHPPTWCSIIYTALSEKTYKSSTVYKIAERFGKRGVADEFIKNYYTIIKDNLVEKPKQVVYRDFE